MPDTTDLIVWLLQRIQVQMNSVDRKVDTLVDHVQIVKVRVTSIGESLVGVNRRMDNFEVRLDRIERRLDLAEA